MTRLRTYWLSFIVSFCTVAAIAAPAQSIFFTTLFNFDGTNGAGPYAGLVQASDGNFYGTTGNGGAYGDGTVFKITPSGALTVLHNFGGPDGVYPQAGLVQASDGNFYGMTVLGGLGGGNCYSGCGTVFRITPAGALTTLYRFCSRLNCADGAWPRSELVQASDGALYGATEFGGAYGGGTVFKITSSGTLTTVYSFCPQGGYCADGAEPFGGLVQATDGNFYGTTWEGGANLYYGTVFKITPSGTLTTLYSFCSQPNCADGAGPYAGLVQATDGNFYGTTDYEGTVDYGTVFKITPDGILTTLHSFDGTDGASPWTAPVQATDGNFYGTTPEGGAGSSCNYSCGTVYEITAEGTLTTLHSFAGPDGAYPEGGLVQASNGFFYGTTSSGGAYGYGTVFRVGVAGGCATCRR